jgi:hypothetical protein
MNGLSLCDHSLGRDGPFLSQETRMTNETRELDDCELDAVVGGFVTQLMAEAQKMSFMMAAADNVIKNIGEHTNP